MCVTKAQQNLIQYDRECFLFHRKPYTNFEIGPFSVSEKNVMFFFFKLVIETNSLFLINLNIFHAHGAIFKCFNGCVSMTKTVFANKKSSCSNVFKY